MPILRQSLVFSLKGIGSRDEYRYFLKVRRYFLYMNYRNGCCNFSNLWVVVEKSKSQILLAPLKLLNNMEMLLVTLFRDFKAAIFLP
jgi:hypothetical protein